jgi:ABC-2 type transport system ATP-binding protein
MSGRITAMLETDDPEGLDPSTDGATTAAIETVGLTKQYGQTLALDGLTMRVPTGTVFGFLGPNGAGKTTTVKLLLGLARPSGGTGRLLGRSLGDRSARKRIGYLPELFRYQAWLTATDVLDLHRRLIGDPAIEIRAVREALGTVGLTDRADTRVGGFSKGMQQRLGLAVALLGRPSLVILDEPTSALDPIGRLEVRTVIRGLRDRGTTVFLNSHLLGEVERVCDEVAIVNRGRVVAAGRLDDLLGVPMVRIRATGVDAALAGRLAVFGHVASDGPWITIRGCPPERVPDLVAAVVGARGRVYAVEPGHETLEERFIELLRAEPTQERGTGSPGEPATA